MARLPTLASLAALFAAASATPSASAPEPSSVGLLEGSSPIWHSSNASARYVFLRSPDFTLPSAQPSSATLHITAVQSPNVGGQGTTQSKLLGE